MGGFVNPVIQAIVEGRKLSEQAASRKLEADKIAEQVRANKAEESIRQRNLDIATQSMQHEHEYHTAMIDAESRKQQLEREIAHITAKHTVAQMATIPGFDPSMLGPKVSNNPNPQLDAGNATLPEFQDPTYDAGLAGLVNKNGLPSAQAALEQKLAEFKGTEGIRLGNEKELLKARGDLEKELEGIKYGHEKELKGQELQQAKELTYARIGSDQGIARMHNDTQLQLAGMLPTKPGETNPLVLGAIHGLMTGQIQPSESNPIVRAAYTSMVNSKMRPPSKNDIGALQGINQLYPQFQQMEDFANKYLPSEKERGSVAAKAESMVNKPLLDLVPSDAKTKLEEIQSNVSNYARGIEGMTGRPLAMTLNAATHSLVGTGMTREQALDKINNLKNMVIAKEELNILGGMPDIQQKEIMHTYGIIPPSVISAPSTTPKGRKLDTSTEAIHRSIDLGHPIYAGE